MLLQAVGAARDPASGGRQMPSHWGSPELHIFTGSSPTGTQFVQAIGRGTTRSRYLNPGSDEITLVSTGEGATSEGEFWECMNSACLDKLPLLVLVEDNGYAISVPVERQTAGGNIARLLEGFPNLFRIEVDGTDFIASYRAMAQAADYVRRGHGPALVHASVTRPYSHSLSDDEKLYKTRDERKAEAARDPFVTYPEFLIDGRRSGPGWVAGHHARGGSSKWRKSRIACLTKPLRRAVLLSMHLYSERLIRHPPDFEREPKFTGEPRTMVDSINQTLAKKCFATSA